MAGKIRLLPDTVANQIAAGEVVNRPASVVKEMVENAVDAGARSITVSYRGGGKELIRVVDDGEGMNEVDARLAFDKHATSKITKLEDVYALHTFGFRGEALASIGAIAHVELTTRRAEHELGTKVLVEGSRFQSQDAVVAPVGSSFAVKNLFYNVPARRRALEKSTTEPRHIIEEMRRVALCHPEMSFALYGEDAPLYNLQPSSLKQRIVGLIGKSVANNLLEVQTDTSIVRVKGFVGHPRASRQTNREQYLFVNGRFFKSPYFHKAVMQAYGKLIPTGAQPSYFIFLEVAPQSIDVNIHPQKVEVKFEEGVAVWQIIHASVREALAKTGATPSMDFEPDGNIEIPVLPRGGVDIRREPVTTRNSSYNPFEHAYPTGRAHDVSFTRARGSGLGAADRDSVVEGFESSIEYAAAEGEQQVAGFDVETGAKSAVLMLGGGMVATSERGELVLVNLRRAKEVVLYERYVTMLGNDTSVTQRLMFPEVMTFSNDDVSLLGESVEDFSALGFEYVVMDGNRVEITGIPADFAVGDVQDLMYDMIDIFRDDTACPMDIRREHLAQKMAAKGSLATPNSFSEGEITAILEAVADGRHSYTPDGRPVRTRLTSDEIKKLFFSR